MEHPIINRTLEFTSGANNRDNVLGNPSYEKVVLYDDFNQVTLDATNDYTVTVAGTTDSVAISTTPGAGGWVALLSGDVDNEACFMATELVFDITKNPVCECRVQFATIAETAFFFGFSDAKLETTPAMPIDFDSGTCTAAAADVAGFIMDFDSTVANRFYLGASTTATNITPLSSGITAVNSTNYVLRVALDSDGYANFFINGVLKGRHGTAISDVPLCIMLASATRANGGGDYVYVDYIKGWQDR